MPKDNNDEKLQTLLRAANALLRSMEMAPAANPQDAWRFSSYKEYALKYNALYRAVESIEAVDAPLDYYNEKKIPSNMNTIAIQQSEIFQSVHANLSILCAWLEQRTDIAKREANTLVTFLQARLRSAIFVEPEKEVDVQNSVEQLLIGRGLQKGIDYDRETGRVKISVKESVPDFVFRSMSLALEVKLVRERSRHGALVDEINADVLAYSTAYNSLIFLVYDLGTIRDELEFKRGLEASGNVSVVLVKH